MLARKAQQSAPFFLQFTRRVGIVLRSTNAESIGCPTRRPEVPPAMASPRLSPAVFLMGSIVLMALLDKTVPVVQWMPWPWNLTGLLPVGLGGLLIWWSVSVLSRHATTPEPFQAATALVTSGPFRMSRNPMYVGATLVLLGIALVLGTATPFLVLPLYLYAMHRRVVRPEEDVMRALFGEAYARYQTRVRRWL